MYLAGSRSDRAFRSAMALPCLPPPDWGWAAEVVRTTGRIPETDPEQWFPASLVAAWLKEAGVDADLKAIKATARGLADAKAELFARSWLQSDFHANALPKRDHVGPSQALRDQLKLIAEGAEQVRSALQSIRGEIGQRRANGTQPKKLEALHTQLHLDFSWGQVRRQYAMGQPMRADSFDPSAEIGSRATLASTWLEEGLACLSEAAAMAWLSKDLFLEPSSTRRMKPGRDKFIQDLAAIWFKVSATRPTVHTRDDQGYSGFQVFHEYVCGHVAGLVIRDGHLVWDEIGDQERSRLRSKLVSLGLTKISPTTLARCVRGLQFNPGQEGSK